jgi:hypothetical protein
MALVLLWRLAVMLRRLTDDTAPPLPPTGAA